ncbi:putative lipoprotein [Plesiocystis pacifica SIR-1]|uniref:Putative lipoprotein n=1 Tax=Plesiocystis pacifica SIR-1 TaxID=391625 RepID=A6G4X9_9BACT|nr:putative lipoprotein [Plesiocystis pacifica SIR-1]
MNSALCLGLCLPFTACTDDASGATTDDSGSDDEVGSTEESSSGEETETGSSTGETTEESTEESTEETTDETTEDTTDETTEDTTDETTEDTTEGVESACGDGIVEGDEVCDDGVNDGAYGGCNADCMSLAAYCGDAEVNGPEDCDDANAELDDGCLDDCTAPSSCADLLAYDDALEDGVYAIAPEGWDGEPFDAYCDMEDNGWTLVMRFAPSGGQFDFYSPAWTDASLVNEGVLDPADDSDGKFQAYLSVPAMELRGCMRHPMTNDYACKAYDLPMTATAVDLFTNTPIGSDLDGEGLYFTEDDNQKLEWLTIQGRSVAESSVSPNYIEVGVNIDDDQSCYDAKVRFGLVLNNESNISTLNDAAGFGTASYYTSSCDFEGQDAPWRTPAGFSAGPNIYETAGTIWVR